MPSSAVSSVPTWIFSWIIIGALAVIGNAVVGWIIHSTPGYSGDSLVYLDGYWVEVNADILASKHKNPSILGFVMLYATQPRLSWVVLGFLHIAYSSFLSESGSSPWKSAFLASLMAEVAMQIFALSLLGRLIQIGMSNGYYDMGQAASAALDDAGRFFANSTMAYFMTAIIFCVVAIWLMVIAFLFGFWDPFCVRWMRATIIIGLLGPYMTSWIFWAAYLKLSSDG
jgi:hypothetical protein